jgi:hypothetical protein
MKLDTTISPRFKLGHTYSYDNTATLRWGFTFAGVFITDPTLSECRRFDTDPSYYGLSTEEAAQLTQLNQSAPVLDLRQLAETALDAAVKTIQDAIGQRHGDFAGLYFDGRIGDQIRALLCDYAVAETQNLIAQPTDEDTVSRGDPEIGS